MRLSDQPDLFCQLQQLNPHICARNNHVWGWIHTETWLLCLREYIDSDAKLWLELEALMRPGFFFVKRGFAIWRVRALVQDQARDRVPSSPNMPLKIHPSLCKKKRGKNERATASISVHIIKSKFNSYK
jgi:hypothetical protein